jgi:hypothetical protein
VQVVAMETKTVRQLYNDNKKAMVLVVAWRTEIAL